MNEQEKQRLETLSFWDVYTISKKDHYKYYPYSVVVFNWYSADEWEIKLIYN